MSKKLPVTHPGKENIPCSVSLLTFNSAAGLSDGLRSLGNFAEIIVCDGNSTDRTPDIARRFGARILKQYDTEEPNTPCAMDKAAMRERAMSLSTKQWRFFMDADDALSPETVAELRVIVSDPHPKHLVWRMPTRIFIDGMEILHEATYPSYQTRLVHEKVSARFKGHVHERLVWDEKKYPVGTMRSFYDFHWSSERVAHYWDYLRGYAERELQVLELNGFAQTLYWSYRRLRTILGYVLWRLPFMYLWHGFRDSMPLPLELTIVRYHSAMLWGIVANYVKTRFWFVLFVETLRGKDLNRVLCNLAVRGEEAYGRVLDIGGGRGSASYWRYLRTRRWFRKTTLDIDERTKPDVALDLEKDDLPFTDEHFNTVLMFNLLE